MPDYSPTSTNTSSAGLGASLSMDSLQLDPYEYPVAPYSDEAEHSSSSSSLSAVSAWPHAYVQIDLKCTSDDSSRSSLEDGASFTLDLDESDLTDAAVLGDYQSWNWQRRVSVSTATPIRNYVPTVTFSSSTFSPLSRYESVFRAQKDGKTMCEESTPLKLISEPHRLPSLFKSSMLPKYWSTVSSDPGKYHSHLVLFGP